MDIRETLESADNEGTSCPYWLIIDARQMMRPDCYTVASMITGPFFCREDAESHLKARRYNFGKNAVVYCSSGCWSAKYKELCRGVNQG